MKTIIDQEQEIKKFYNKFSDETLRNEIDTFIKRSYMMLDECAILIKMLDERTQKQKQKE